MTEARRWQFDVARSALCPWLERLEARLGADDGGAWFSRVAETAGLAPSCAHSADERVLQPPAPTDPALDLEAIARRIADAILTVGAGHRPSGARALAWFEHAFVLVAAAPDCPWAAIAANAAARLGDPEEGAPDAKAAATSFRVVGRHELLQLIGAGASGTVYRAVHRDSGRPAAVKLMRLDAASPDHVVRFRREARVAAALHHPCIAQLLDSGVHVEGGLSLPFLVFELIEGVPFSEFARNRPLREVLATFADTCSAVQHAHQRGIVHRDLKPANVLVDAEDQPHVLDFGVARLLNDTVTATASGRILGTPAFMSPEQARGQGSAVDKPSDVFGLGAILFEALTGEPPFDLSGLTGHAAMRRVAEHEPRRVLALRGDLPRDLAAVVQKALAVDPRDRYADAGELARDVRRFLDGHSVVARPPSALRSWQRRIARKRLQTFAIAVLVAGSATSTWLWLQTAQVQRAYRTAAVEAVDGFETVMQLAAELGELTVHSKRLLELAEHTLASLTRLRSTTGDQGAPELERVELRLRETAADMHQRAGMRAEALEHRIVAAAIARRLLGTGELEPTRELARTIVKLGDVCMDVGRREECRSLYEEAHALFVRNSARHPDDVSAADDLAWSHSRLATLADALVPVADPATHARRFLAIAEDLADRDESPTRHHTLASALLLQLKPYADESPSPRSQLKFAQRALHHAQRAVELAPNRRVYRLTEISAMQNLARTMADNGYAALEVRTRLQVALGLASDLAATDPKDLTAQVTLHSMLAHVAEFEQGLGRFTRAEQVQRRRLQHLRAMRSHEAMYARSLQDQRSLALHCEGLADRRSAAAAVAFWREVRREALALLTAGDRPDPLLLLELAELLLPEISPSDARQAFLRAAEVLRELPAGAVPPEAAERLAAMQTRFDAADEPLAPGNH